MIRHPIPVLLSLALLVCFAVLGLELRLSAPSFTALSALVIDGESRPVVLGYRELAQRAGSRSADERHLQVQQVDGEWQLANLSTERRVDAPTDRARTRHLKRWRLQAGDRIQVGTTVIEVAQSDAEQLTLRTGSREARWQDGRLSVQAPLWVDCPEDPNPLRRLLARWIDDSKERRLFSIGGAVDCAARWAMPDLPSRGLVVYRHLGGWWLGPGIIDREARLLRGGEPELGFADLALPVDGPDGRVQRLIIGRTHYRVDADEDALRLSVLTGADAWIGTRPDDREQLRLIAERAERMPITQVMTTWRWMGQGLGPIAWASAHGTWLAGAALAAVAAVLAVLFAGRLLDYDERRIVRRWLLQWPLPSCGIVIAIALWRTGDGDLFLLMATTWAAWAAATLALLLRGRLAGRAGLYWCGLLFLAGTGALTLTQLASGADNTSWLRMAILHLLVLSTAGWIAYWLAWLRVDTLRSALVTAAVGGGTIGAVARVACLGLVGAALILQLPLGSEHGLFGIQPVEAAKLALLLVLAVVGMHIEEFGFVGAQHYRDAPLSLLWGLLLVLFGIVLVLMIPLVGVRDLSPILLMVILLLAWSLDVTPALPPLYRWPLRLLLIGAVSALIGGGLVLYAAPDTLPAPLASLVPEDRFRVWGEPWRFPHSGAQLLQALDLGSRSGLWGAADGWRGWTGWTLPAHWDPRTWTLGTIGTIGWFGINGGEVMTLPEVHNDFIATFFIHHFGILPAMILLAVQTLVLVLLFDIARRILRWGLDGNRDDRETGRVLALAIRGFTWLLAGHWLIAWGNVLGALPVMGQPMSWLAAANSHLLLFVLPGSFLALICAWVAREGA